MRGGIKLKIIIICIVVSMMAIFVMSRDHYRSVDETVTYSMANNNYNGWMFSSGRVGEYFKNEVVGENIVETAENFVDFVLDLVCHFKNAAYFSYPRPSETGWYSGTEVQNWLKVTPGERFDYGSVYINAMGDESNPFLYYALVHTVGSVFMRISDTLWAGFIVNIMAMNAVIILLYLTAKKMGISESIALISVICYGLSGACLHQVTESRAYIVAAVFQLLLFYFHLELYDAALNAETNKCGKIICKLAVTYLVGYMIHYTILFWAGFLGVNTVIVMWRDKRLHKGRYLKKYICGVAFAIVLGFMVEPVSVMGLLLKFLRDSGNGDRNIISLLEGTMRNTIIRYVSGDVAGLWVIGVLFLISLFFFVKKSQKSVADKRICFLGICLLEEMVVIPIITGLDYFKALYPLIFLMMVCVIFGFISTAAEKYSFKYIKIFALAAITIFGIHSVYRVLEDKEEEGAALWARETVLKENYTDNLVFVRKRGGGYEFVPALQEYDNILVITIPQIAYEEFGNSEIFLESEELTVVTCDDMARDIDLLEWLKNNGFLWEKLLMEDDACRIYHVGRR